MQQNNADRKLKFPIQLGMQVYFNLAKEQVEKLKFQVTRSNKNSTTIKSLV